jgi:hypothetical protein
MTQINHLNSVFDPKHGIAFIETVENDGFVLTPLLYFGPILSMVIICLALLIILLIKEGKKQQLAKALHSISSFQPVVISSVDMDDSESRLSPVEYKTVFSLTIQRSADRTLVGQKFDFAKSSVCLGCSAVNDVFSLKDFGDNGNQTVIQYRNGQFVLRQESYQTDTQIRSVSSSYLYVNDHPVDSEVTIEHGDLIRIGKTFEFRFE